MIAVLFEVELKPEHKQRYFDIAATLRPELEKIEGFISVERFQSLTDKNKILSLSIFEDEAAVTRWRTAGLHREAQSQGRNGIFATYRLRIASVIRDYGMTDRDEAPTDA